MKLLGNEIKVLESVKGRHILLLYFRLSPLNIVNSCLPYQNIHLYLRFYGIRLQFSSIIYGKEAILRERT